MRSIGAMPAAVAAQVAGLDGVLAVAPVLAGQLLLTGGADVAGTPVDAPAAGWGIPMEAIAVDPAVAADALPTGRGAELAPLDPGTVLLGETSSRLRGLTAGTVVLGGRTLGIAGVADDALVGSAKVVLHTEDATALGLSTPRYLLVRTDGDPSRAAAIAALVAPVPKVLSSDLEAGPSPAPSWREVLPQALLKERLGEFAVRYGSRRSMQQEAGWASAHIVTAEVPVLGSVTCNAALIEPLRAAMAELVELGVAATVDPGDYAGCFAPRAIGPGAGASRHAWGAAVDLNASRNAFGAASTQDARLVEVMRCHGFGFGGDWPVPDPMHFEYVGD